MDKIRLGIISPSDVALRRFMPGLLKSDVFVFGGVAVASVDEWPTIDLHGETAKALKFTDTYGGRLFHSYRECIESNDIDAVYVPLPPSLHAYWGRVVLKSGKHLLLEKPFTVNSSETAELLALAKERDLAVHENYAFLYHRRIAILNSLLDDNRIGSIRLIRADFGFPYRGAGDFRYHGKLGGGALLDCGGYPIRLASMLLGGGTVATSALGYMPAHDVDVFGSVTMLGNKGQIAQVGFGMDNHYRCDLEIWGERGTMRLPRIFTPPADMETEIIILEQSETERIAVKPDDQFACSIERFYTSIVDSSKRYEAYQEIQTQSGYISEIMSNAYILDGGTV